MAPAPGTGGARRVGAVARGWRWLAVLAAIAGAMTVPGGAAGQEPFRVTYKVERQDAGKTTMTGTVQNEARSDVIDVYVTAEALDANKKVLARGIAFVTSSLRQGGTAPFTLSIPAPPTANAFRVRVSSYRMGLAIQGP